MLLVGAGPDALPAPLAQLRPQAARAEGHHAEAVRFPTPPARVQGVSKPLFDQRPDGRALVPVMPWVSYSALTEADVAALVAYLRTLRPVRHRAPANTPPGQPAPAPYLSLTPAR